MYLVKLKQQKSALNQPKILNLLSLTLCFVMYIEKNTQLSIITGENFAYLAKTCQGESVRHRNTQ